MEIKIAFPPNYDKIAAKFDLTGKTPIFCYGDVIYNPHGGGISADIQAHEAVHTEQQKAMGVEKWWNKYLEDSEFRLQQEVEAYRAQYKFLLENTSRPYRRARTKAIVEDLSSAMYGNLITKEQALKLITK